ncbi:MAG: ribonuclease HII [Candidatus Woesearchaeota archaeon]
MVKICGIDEAGRGPVIGPMVLCGVMIRKEDEHKLIDLGVKDSKMLLPARRRGMVDSIKDAAEKVEVMIAQPSEIDECLREEGTNLNWLEADHMAIIIDRLKPEMTYLDCPSNNMNAFANYVRTKLESKTEIKCDHKADTKYPVVAAASIIAKVTRDAEIERIKKEVGFDFGSGYPSDPITKRFLEENWDKHPYIFRHSWSSYSRVAHSNDQRRLGDY